MLERSEWYDIARDTNWTPSCVSREALFPPQMGGPLRHLFRGAQTAHPLR